MKFIKYTHLGDNMSKRFVLSGYFGFKNFGDEAILSLLIERLKQYKHRITVISSDPQYTKSKYHHIRCVYTFNFRDIIGAILKSDCLISGGGSLLQDTTSFKSLIYYLSVILIALILRKQVIIFAQGIGPINNRVGKFLTKNILRNASYISVRDAKSQELLKIWGINSELLCDPVFSKTIKETQKTNSIAVQLRGFKNLNEDFIDRLAQRVVQEFSGYDINIYSFQDTIDLPACRSFEKAVRLLNPNIITTVYSGLTDEQIINGIASSKYLIAMRFHAIIIGLISNVKTLCINYDIKVKKIASEFKLPLIDLNTNFENQFEELKDINLNEINTKVCNKEFDWSGFDNLINN